MNPVSTHKANSPSRFAWLQALLKEELSPYPGRSARVARMVIAATLVMIVDQTFQIPYAAIGAIYALTIARESTQATRRFVRSVVAGFATAAVYVLLGAIFFANYPLLRFLWVVGTLFLMFFLLSALTDFVAATGFGYLMVITIPLWDQQIPAEPKIEGTLWAVGGLAVAGVITIALEIIFAEFSPGDPVIRAVSRRLTAVQELLSAYAEGREPDRSTHAEIVRLAKVGTSRLRSTIQRSGSAAHYRDRIGALVALAGRVTDISLTLTYLDSSFSEADRKRALALAGNLRVIRTYLTAGKIPKPIRTQPNNASASVPLLHELEDTMRLIPQVFVGSEPQTNLLLSPPAAEPSRGMFVADAWSNPEHVRFALKGCLAASLCYVAYNFLFWPGISTAVTTCLLTALTTIGASHQKQALRLGGALAGGMVAIGAQIFVLPSLDSIAGFTVLFIVVTIAATWIATSSPRIAYFGLQIAGAFYLINLEQFKIQTSLTFARDRVVGIGLGLAMMWLVYDRLWGTSAAVEMKRTFVGNLRLLAQFAREPTSTDMRTAVARSYSLRETISANLDKVRTLADGVLFEFGKSRASDIALRERIRSWQPELRSLFALRISLLKYRLQLPGFTLPEPVRSAQREFDERLADALDGMADRLEGKHWNDIALFRRSHGQLERSAQEPRVDVPNEECTGHVPSFLALSETIGGLTESLSNELA
jgi:multidrug resistance protein MdtO